MWKTVIKCGVLVVGLLFLTGCSQIRKTQTGLKGTERETAVAEVVVSTETESDTELVQEDTELEDGICVQESSKRIPYSLVNTVFEDIKAQISASEESFGKCEDYKLEVCSERKKKDGRIWEKLFVYYDLIPVRKAEDDPLIVGMKEARDSLTDAKQIACADKEIDEWIKEIEGDYQQQKDEPDQELQIFLAYNPGGDDYSLYCDTHVDGHYMQITLEEYLHTEDYETKKERGKEYIYNVVKN